MTNEALFYPNAVNAVFGDPGCGKTWVILAAICEALKEGEKAAFIDMDHNGARAIGERLILLGAPRNVICSDEHFRMAIPRDAAHLNEVVADLVKWGVDTVGVDSIGELIPLMGGDSNSADDYSRVHRQVLVTLANSGACVIAADHMSKSADSRAVGGATGTIAKKRAVDGSYLKATAIRPFAPGKGGAAALNVEKDRHGGVLENCAQEKLPLAATFVMLPKKDGVVEWYFKAAQTTAGQKVETAEVSAELHRHRLINAIAKQGENTSQNQLVKSIPGRDVELIEHLQALEEEGLIRRVPRTGRGGGFGFELTQRADLPMELQEIRDALMQPLKD